MVEGGVVKAADKTELTECWKVTWKTPYIMRLAFSAGTGGLLFALVIPSHKVPKDKQETGSSSMVCMQRTACS
ncbi:hypothetical protein NC653_035747 [Populus alba x Populus x berolinensis]|uniref:Uncharacterized protein n=1 Tax=Populus alba x Populus x berolinensis TaxID=444605 RepID=A0AAD6LI80_9ROSI|nr:hypothetical protein NC653_035747 [Populus alba x Populus x berolinensis]